MAHGAVGFAVTRSPHRHSGQSGRDDHRVTLQVLSGAQFQPRQPPIADGHVVAIPDAPALGQFTTSSSIGCSAPVFTDRVLRLFRGPPVWQLLWRGYAAVVGGIIIVAVWTTDRGRSAVITGGVISTRGGSADRSSTDSGSTDA